MIVRHWAGRRVLRAILLGPAVLLFTLGALARPAAAHPLDVYLQATYLSLAPSTVTVEMDLSPGVLVAPRVLQVLDRNGDQQVSDTEARTYLQQVLQAAEVRVDNSPMPLKLTRVDVPPYRTIQAGYGTLRIFASATGAPAATAAHRLFFRNGFSDPKAAYQVNAFAAARAPVVLGTQQRDPTQRQASVSYRTRPAAAGSAQPAATSGQARPSARAAPLAGYLEEPSLSVGVVLLALGAAALLGALHALTPGHAKTLMAAYLVGSGSTARNAVTLAAVVTFTHTASVVLIGLIALLASQFLVPGVLVPALELVAGLLVVGLGLRLLRQRWPRTRTAPREHQHQHEVGGHEHAHQPDHRPVHQHGGRAHSHALPAERVTPRSLIAMGVSGGLVPCPEALGVMILAVGVNRTVLGLGLILSFSVGLAVVLIGLGLLLVRSRALLSRFDRLGTAWTTLLPLVSAAVVTVLGLGLIAKGFGADLLPPV